MGSIVEIEWSRPPIQIVNEKTRGVQGMMWLANEFRKEMSVYVPMDTGHLAQNVQIMATDDQATVMYKSPYAHYQYTGIVFVDPKYNIGAFTNGDDLFWSRPGVAKKPSARKMNYSTGRHPKAQSKWDEPVRTTRLPALIAAYQRYIGG